MYFFLQEIIDRTIGSGIKKKIKKKKCSTYGVKMLISWEKWKRKWLCDKVKA